jgi:hypothetical protein
MFILSEAGRQVKRLRVGDLERDLTSVKEWCVLGAAQFVGSEITKLPPESIFSVPEPPAPQAVRTSSIPFNASLWVNSDSAERVAGAGAPIEAEDAHNGYQHQQAQEIQDWHLHTRQPNLTVDNIMNDNQCPSPYDYSARSTGVNSRSHTWTAKPSSIPPTENLSELVTTHVASMPILLDINVAEGGLTAGKAVYPDIVTKLGAWGAQSNVARAEPIDSTSPLRNDSVAEFISGETPEELSAHGTVPSAALHDTTITVAACRIESAISSSVPPLQQISDAALLESSTVPCDELNMEVFSIDDFVEWEAS